MRKLSELQAPALAGVIREETAIKAIAEIKNCFYDGATKEVNVWLKLKSATDND